MAVLVIAAGCSGSDSHDADETRTPKKTVTSTAPPPTASTTTTVPRGGYQWKFHIVTGEGWEYDVDLPVTFSPTFSKTVSESPPGMARFASSITANFSPLVTPTIAGRNAPDLKVLGMWAHFELPAEFDLTVRRLGSTEACTVPGVGGSTGFSCEVLETNSYSSTENVESEVDEAVGILSAQELPLFFEARIAVPPIGCLVRLESNGTVNIQGGEAAAGGSGINTCRITPLE